MSGKKKELCTYKDIEYSIKSTNRVKCLESMIVKLVEWRESCPRTDKQYRESRDLLNFAFDKYEDLCSNRADVAKSTFCSFLNEV